MSKDGGQAFPGQWMDFQPGTGEQVVREQWPGMSLRDWFAGMAVAGFASKHDHGKADVYAIDAYRIADAMIAERDKEDHDEGD